MLGDVPTSVIKPPSSDANAMGIRKTDGEASFFFAIWNEAGISIASAPMFLTSAEATPTDPVSTSSCPRTRVTRRDTVLSARSMIPERCTAAEMTSAEPTMMTMSSEKPVNASLGLTMPSARLASSAMIATTSYRNRPHRKSAIIPTRVAIDRIWGSVIRRHNARNRYFLPAPIFAGRHYRAYLCGFVERRPRELGGEMGTPVTIETIGELLAIDRIRTSSTTYATRSGRFGDAPDDTGGRRRTRSRSGAARFYSRIRPTPTLRNT